MKAILNIIFAGAVLLGVFSCSKDASNVLDTSGPVTLKANIANEVGTKATLDESSGAFAFSADSPKDVIKVYNGIGVYASTDVTISGSTATFTMADGFTNTGSGYAAFPDDIVSTITASGVTFNLPTTYAYSQVGSSIVSASADAAVIAAAASTSRVPCPMVATYTAGSSLLFKQAGAVVRFRVTDCVAGSLTFTFTTPVTGTVTLAGVPSGDGGGILAANLSSAGYSITVTGVPEVTAGNYIYVTLPVPTGTDPMNVGVWNNGASANKVATLSGAAATLNRAGGYKRGVTLADVEQAAMFDGLSLDGYLYFDGSSSYSVIKDPLWILSYYHVDYTTNKYYFNWEHLDDNGFCSSGGVTIGGSNYRIPTGGVGGEWARIVGISRGAAKVNGCTAHYAFVTVTHLDYDTDHKETVRGLLLFPDNSIIAVPSGVTIAGFDASSDSNVISDTEHDYFVNQGCTFLPMAGYCENSWLSWNWNAANLGGYYWSSGKFNSTNAFALALEYDTGENKIYSENRYSDWDSDYFPVRLIRVTTP